MRDVRWPALVVIPLVILGMVIAERVGGEEAQVAVTVPDDAGSTDLGASVLLPTAAAPEGPSSTWYCPTLTGGGNPQMDESWVVVANVAGEARTGTLTVFGAEGQITEHPFEVPPRTRWQIDPGRFTDEGRIAGLVELDGGGVAVASVLFGRDGRDVTPCASETAPDTVIPAAATTLDATAVLTLFNPFPDEAVLEISFVTAEDVRVPTAFEGYPVPAGSVVAVDLTDVVTVRDQFVTRIEARTGQIAGAMVQSYDGSEGVRGFSALPGAPAPAETWAFPVASHGETLEERFVVFNPGETEALVQVSVAFDDPEAIGAVEPFERTVPGGEFVVIGSADEEWGRVRPGVGHRVTVRSQNEVPVVAGGILVWSTDDPVPGYASALGIPVTAGAWIVPVASLPETAGSVAVVNPSPLEPAEVEVAGLEEGSETELDPRELLEGRRAEIDVASALGGAGRALAAVRSEATVVVASSLRGSELGRSWSPAVPVAGTVEVPAPLEGAPTDR